MKQIMKHLSNLYYRYFYFDFVQGNFTVAFGSVAGEKFQLLTTIPDEGEKSLTLYTAQVKIP